MVISASWSNVSRPMYEARADSPPPGRNCGDVIIGGGDGTDHDGDMAKREKEEDIIDTFLNEMS